MDTLLEATRHSDLEKVTCPKCEGVNYSKCDRCNGDGWVWYLVRVK